jgi:phosphotransferase system enzyme I (PtsI)
VEIAINGIGVSPGIAIGPALTFGVESIEVPRYLAEDREAELDRFHKALAEAREDLRKLADQTAKSLGQQHADIFEAHLMILEDVAFREEIERQLELEGYNVEFLVDDFIARSARAIESVDDARFRERARDLVDVGQRLLAKLMNTNITGLQDIERPSVIVAHDLSPSDTANLDLPNTLGLATDVSGPTSHTAILARALEIPAVVGLKYVGQHTTPGDTIIVDGTHGRVIVRPSEDTLQRMREAQHLEAERREALLLRETSAVSATHDGHAVPTLVNIELPVEIAHGIRNKAQGVGLYRTEYLFLNRSTLPSEDEQYEAYANVAEAMKPYSVTLRTLDLGGDKFASHIHYAEEINPQMGWRAIRFCLERPDIFKSQLRALFRASVHGNVQVMFPLISGLDEYERVMEMVQEVFDDLERRGVAHNPNIKIGTMIEVPSAVAVADVLSKHCDFFSIGTNDLIQYSLAVDRVNEKIAHMYEPAHPAVIRMIHQTVQAAKAAGIPCSICGEMAGDPTFTELLVGLGVDSLSMSSVALPLVRAELANIEKGSAEAFARDAMSIGRVAEIKKCMEERLNSRRSFESYYEESHTQEAPEGSRGS